MSLCRDRTKPAVCPQCDEGYAWRVPKRLDGSMSLCEFYRHRTMGYVYVHRITEYE